MAKLAIPIGGEWAYTSHSIIIYTENVILCYITGLHEWALGSCQHPPLDVVSREKDYMISGSAAH